VAGHPDFIDERRAYRLPDDPEVQRQLTLQAEALEGRHGGLLWIVSKADGRPAARYRLESPPVFDGMAAAEGRLFVSTLDGSVVALGGEGPAALPRAEPDAPVQVISDEPDEPDYLKPPEVDKSGDFDRVTRCRVVQCDLGYRLTPGDARPTCLALRKLERPLVRSATLTSTLSVPGTSGFLVNGFIAFGDGAADERLVKCGIRFRTGKATIIQGAIKASTRSTAADVDASVGKPVDLTVRVDLDRQTVTLAAGATTVEAQFAEPLKQITHVGFCTDQAVADFSDLQVAGD
jgi:hypothetical protein